MAKNSGHPLGVTGRMLFGAAITTVGMGLSAGVAAADPADSAAQSTEDSRPAPPADVRTMTDQELGAELGRVAGKDSLREQEVVTEMKSRGAQFWEAAPAPNGVGVSGGVPVRPGVSVTGTIAYDSYTGSWYVSGGVRAGKPAGPKFTGIAPKPDGLNANGTMKLDLGEYGEFSSTVDLNLAPDGSVTGGYTAKGTVTTPDGRSYEAEVKVERNADGTLNVELPDGYTTSTTLPGGGTVDTTTPADPTEERPAPEVKGPAPKTGEQQKKSGGWSDWFDWSGGVSVDKEIHPAPAPPPTQEEVDRAKESWHEHQRAAKQRQDAWRAQNRPEAQYREGLERAQQRADAAEAARRAAMPDRDHDDVPDEEDRTWNQNDTDPASSDVGDGPEGGTGYPSDRVDTPEPTGPPESDDPDADHDRDGIRDQQDATWNQNDTDPASADVGDGPEGGEGYRGSDATPNENDTDPGSTERGVGRESGGLGSADADGDGLTGSADATPNQNDTDPASSDRGDGPEGGEGYGGSDRSGYGDPGSDAGSVSDADSGGFSDSGSFSGSLSDSGSDSGVGSNSGSDSGSDAATGSGVDSGSGADSASSTGADSGSASGSGADSSSSSGGYSGGYGDADGDGLSGSADSTPNQNDTDPSSTDVGDGPEGNSGYSGSTDAGDCACV